MATRKRQTPAPELPSHALDEVPATLGSLADAMLTLRSREELLRFLRDLCTAPELEALTHRWEIVNLLEQRVPYLEISSRVGTSTTTVTRVAQWFRNGTGGYRLALDRVAKKR
jgi:TrpR-related protein YerC/YecD